MIRPRLTTGVAAILLLAAAGLSACDRAPGATTSEAVTRPAPPDSIEARFRNVATSTAYVGDSACASCHAVAAASYARHSMAKSFHRWTPDVRVERAMSEALRNTPTGYAYRVVDSAGSLWQVETRPDDAAQPRHELRRRIDYVMGSGRLARTYFTEENGRLFQLPLTWYANHGWDFSPGYEVNNARFSRVLPDRCVACHASYPQAAPHLEGKYPVLRPGIGCERCHGPGALHVAARRGTPMAPSGDTTRMDSTIVNPARLPLDRRLDVCEQCHVHTSVAVLRAGRTAFDFTPARQLEAQYAYFKNGGDIDLVSHADRLRQSACFRASAASSKPLECASCHDPHAAPPTRETRNQPCLSCHAGAAFTSRFTSTESRRAHAPRGDCVSCHMPVVKERTVPHGTFSDHWIRVPGRPTPTPTASGSPIEPYFARDRTGPEGALYRAMGKVVFASLSGRGEAFDQAAEELAPLLAATPSDGQAHFLLGVAHEARGRLAEAAEAHAAALARGDRRPDVLRALARARFRLGDADEARRLYLEALTKQPALAWMRAEYADVLQHDGDLDGAVREYRAALAEQPSLAAAAFNLGVALLGKGEAAAAAAPLLHAVQLDPAYAVALDALFAVDATAKKVHALSPVPTPLPTVRVPRSPMGFTVEAAGKAQVRFTNTRPDGYVLVYAPDGALLLAVPTNASGAVTWDLRAGDGRVLAPGLYRAELQWRGQSGPAPSTWFALVARTEP